MELITFEPNDIEEVQQLFTMVFSNAEGVSEGELIGKLSYEIINSTDVQDFYGFIAIENKKIIGSVLFTRLTFQNNINAFLLSPMAIDKNYQGKSIGQKLINFGIKHLKENKVKIIFTYGDPQFYSKVGFKQISEKLIEAPFKLSQPEGWLAQSLISDQIESITGHSHCVKAFNKPKIW